MSIIKTAFFFLVLLSVATSGLYLKSNVSASANANRIASIAPIVISKNGAVRFPERVPPSETVLQIQIAIQSDDAQALNDLLVKHRFYVLPGR
ncbi:MAG: hypothetical protein L3J39_12800 [Verrucomicrobiales bacterium]|nr:hypothetical protein [Verrucomicrobiales bacterium]